MSALFILKIYESTFGKGIDFTAYLLIVKASTTVIHILSHPGIDPSHP